MYTISRVCSNSYCHASFNTPDCFHQVPAKQGNFEASEHMQQLVKLVLPDQSFDTLSVTNTGHMPIAAPKSVREQTLAKVLLCFASKDLQIAAELAAELAKLDQIQPVLCEGACF